MAVRDRMIPLLVLVIGVVLAGALWRAASEKAPPSVCERPGWRAGSLVCDGSGTPLAAEGLLVGAKLDINRATERDLVAVPGIGPRAAQRIVAHREAHGAYTEIDGLLEVKGIGEKTLAKFRDQLQVSAAP